MKMVVYMAMDTGREQLVKIDSIWFNLLNFDLRTKYVQDQGF